MFTVTKCAEKSYAVAACSKLVKSITEDFKLMNLAGEEPKVKQESLLIGKKRTKCEKSKLTAQLEKLADSDRSSFTQPKDEELPLFPVLPFGDSKQS